MALDLEVLQVAVVAGGARFSGHPLRPGRRSRAARSGAGRNLPRWRGGPRYLPVG